MKTKNSTFIVVAVATLLSFFTNSVSVNAQAIQSFGYNASPDTAEVFVNIASDTFPLPMSWTVLDQNETAVLQYGDTVMSLPQMRFTLRNLDAFTMYKVQIWVNGGLLIYTGSIVTKQDDITGILQAPVDNAVRITLAGKTLQVFAPDELMGKTVSVANMNGQVILTEKLTETTQHIELPGASSGMHMVSVDGKITKKVMLGN